jgi:DNA mismatch repair protein MutS
VDHTVTAGGARLLDRRLSGPSRDLTVIQARLEAVRYLVDQARLREDLRRELRHVPDIDRALSRLALDRGGPRDLGAVRNGLAQAESIAGRLAGAPVLLAVAAEALTGHRALIDRLDAALVAEPPVLARDGGFIAPGHDAELDETRKLRDEGRGVIAAMQADYVALSGIQGLKIKHNNVLGYFIEVPASSAGALQSPAQAGLFIHRQTVASAMRFVTTELASLDQRGGGVMSLQTGGGATFDALVYAEQTPGEWLAGPRSPARMISLSLRRKDSSTAFFSH